MIYKRATKKLKDAGINDIVIVKRLWGATPHYVSVRAQISTCFKTPDEAVKAVINGFRPTVKE